MTLLPLTVRPVAAVLAVQPTPAPWSARQDHTSSMIELLLSSMNASVTEPASAPPTRKQTSSTVTGSEALFAVEPGDADCSRVGELVGPASKIRPEMLTPGTSATLIVVWPAVGISVAKPRPMILVLALVTLIVEA